MSSHSHPRPRAGPVSDYCSGRIWGLARDETGDWAFQELLDADLKITGAGEDEAGNFYLTSCNCEYGGPSPFENPPGALSRLVPANQVPGGSRDSPTRGIRRAGVKTASVCSGDNV